MSTSSVFIVMNNKIADQLAINPNLVAVTGTIWNIIRSELVAIATIVEALEQETVQQYK